MLETGRGTCIRLLTMGAAFTRHTSRSIWKASDRPTKRARSIVAGCVTRTNEAEKSKLCSETSLNFSIFAVLSY
jgi:hypothetical protein